MGFQASAKGVQDAMLAFSAPYLLYDADIHKKNNGLEAALVVGGWGAPLDEYDPQWKMLAIRDCGYYRDLPDWKFPILEVTEPQRDIEACIIQVPRKAMITGESADAVLKACQAGDVAKVSSLLGAKRVGAGAKELLVNLGYMMVGPTAVKTLAKALSKDLETLELDMSGNNIGPKGAEALAAGLPQNLKVLKINFANNRMNAEGVKALAAKIPKTLEILSLGFAGMKMGTEGATAIANGMPPNLKEFNLDLLNNDVKDDGIISIAKALPKTLEYLNVMLLGNDLSRTGFMILDRMIGDPLHPNHLPKMTNFAFKKTGEIEKCEFKEMPDGTWVRQIEHTKCF